MRRILASTAAALLALGALTPAQAAGSIEVKWVEPDKFTDAGRSSYDREHAMKSIGDYIRSLATSLPEGQTLRLEVLDLDLAGEVRPFHGLGMQEVRVLRGRADWPHMKIRYTLSGAAGSVKSGEADLADMAYLQNPPSSDLRYGDLGYEKRMVQQWFKQTFVAH